MSRLIHPSPFLRRVLWADATVSAGVGVLMAVAAPLIGILTRLPTGLLLAAGLALLPYAAGLAWLATRPAVPAAAIWAPIVLNGVWALACGWIAMAGSVQPNGLGQAFLAVQVVTVLLFAELEFSGLRCAAPVVLA